MDKSYHRSPLVLPKLKAKAELLQALPELRKYFPDAADLIPAERNHRGATRRPAAPADDSDDEEKEAAKTKEELQRVKKERTSLLQALAAARAKSYGRPAGDLQAQDIAAVRTSLAEKQHMLNELRERNAELEQRIETLSVEIRDCSLLKPEEGGGAAGKAGDRLAATLAQHEAAAKEIETRTVQYQLLADRTTRDRDAAQHRMQLARELKEAADDDLHTLSQHYYEMHAAKENAERELGAAVAQYDDSKTAWQRKLRDRRREMKAVERRLAEETAEEAQRAQQAALEAAQKAKERETAQALQYAAVLQENNPAILAKLQEAEATWSRLRAVAGGSSPEEIIAAWQDLRDRAQALQGLLAMTRRQEDQRREELAELQTLQETSQSTGARTSSPHIAKITGINANSNGVKDPISEEEERKKLEKETTLKQQSLHRLESLSAAAEFSLKGLLDQMNAAQEADSELWKRLQAQYQQEKQQQQHRKSVVVNSAGVNSSAQPYRRASLLLPRRVSAIDLAQARSAAAQHNTRRGSIEIPTESQQQQHSSSQQAQPQQRTSVIYITPPVSSLQDEELISKANNTAPTTLNNILPKKAAVSPAAATSKERKNEFFTELPDAIADLTNHFELLLSLEQPSAAQKHDVHLHHGAFAGGIDQNRNAVDNSISSSIHSSPSGYKRNTMAGPAWIESRKNTSPVPAKTKAAPRGSLQGAKLGVDDFNQKDKETLDRGITTRQSVVVGFEAVSPQQAQHEVQAAERYMRRLVGATVEPPAEIEDPFALDSSDEDERPVFDRAALKHRSHKVTHPKQPRNLKSASKTSSKPRPARGLPVALLSP